MSHIWKITVNIVMLVDVLSLVKLIAARRKINKQTNKQINKHKTEEEQDNTKRYQVKHHLPLLKLSKFNTSRVIDINSFPHFECNFI